MNKEKKIPGHILSLFIILLSISGVCLLMYKAQFRFNLHQLIEYVMMTTHKPTGTITLSSDSPVLTETFTCLAFLRTQRAQRSGFLFGQLAQAAAPHRFHHPHRDVVTLQ